MEMKLIAYRKTKDGDVATFLLHPHEDLQLIKDAHVGDDFDVAIRKSVAADHMSEEELLRGLEDLAQ